MTIVSLKKISQSFENESFKSETTNIITSLRHPNIQEILHFEVIDSQGKYIKVCPYEENGSIRDLIHKVSVSFIVKILESAKLLFNEICKYIERRFKLLIYCDIWVSSTRSFSLPSFKQGLLHESSCRKCFDKW